MKKFFKDFKAFIAKGNVVDMAVGVIIGAAFSAIVTSLVNDIVMPLISLAVGGASVADWKWVITEAVYDANGVLVTAETALHYGNFIQAIIDFLLIALCLFLALKIILKLKNGSKFEALTKEEVKAMRKEGKSYHEIHAEDARKKAEAEAAKAPAETTESLLKDIRELLKEKSAK